MKARGVAGAVVIGVAGVALALGFGALGAWQLQRLAWKRALIARVEARVHAPPAPLPSQADWGDAGRQEYRRVTVSGHFLHAHEALAQAVTVLGGGYWVMTPLRTDGGAVIYVNRGFVPPDRKMPATRSAGQLAGPVRITGLLRLPEPGGGFLRRNDPQADRWRSRDVAAMARRAGLPPPAPFFVDADSTPNPGGYPLGGLTVVHFPNNHLVYALTWFVLAGMSLGGAGLMLRHRADMIRQAPP